MSKDKILNFVLENAPANIKYRLLKEIFNEPADSAKMKILQNEILSFPKVKKCFACQRENGFFGSVLHGVYFDGFDSTVNLLKRNGVELTDTAMVKAKESLLSWKDYQKDHFYKAGNAMDEHGRGGFRAILAAQLIELGADENIPQIQQQITSSLNAFRGAMNYTCTDDFSRKATHNGQGCRYYIKGSLFPDSNHIDILEKTVSWRSVENINMVRKSYRHCKELMKDYHDGNIFVNCGYFVGPFNYNWNSSEKKVTIRDFDKHPIDFAWFMRGLGSASIYYPLFNNRNTLLLESLSDMLDDDGFIESISEEQIRQFKNYSSLAPSWRKKEHLACDIYFPLLLAYYKEINKK